ncbi:DUF1365 domain-containing protein [Microbulbifer hydrolyticus]|uniref:DUF1365 family protein n=1 Tax=Microbulbifer hydrolyticus TaxID=48074 RepID=A0A6P1TBV0_9GAMM|nr:DUF1365 domain-containing protein [Microbulbifer hydrolyticus]MBB5210223.1 hypothetical protein [Microbulbifer hydrolyticus]QHQ39271.1 DUF1365 family protein [Microbulbifer hydrolyticus]
MRSGLYSGWIQHRRLKPREHGFRYRGFMVYAFLDELPQIFAQSRWWSGRRGAPASFCREDFYGDPAVPLDRAVRDRVAEETGVRPAGPIALLANWRYFGYNMNPISIYYCFDKTGENVEFLLVDVHNTPWNERHGYVLDMASQGQGPVQRAEFAKSLHVSPFMPLGQRYLWKSTLPDKALSVSIRSIEDGERVFDASMNLKREEISPAALRMKLIQFPLHTVKIIISIYWQALKLLLKRVPIHSHPGRERNP